MHRLDEMTLIRIQARRFSVVGKRVLRDTVCALLFFFFVTGVCALLTFRVL